MDGLKLTLTVMSAYIFGFAMGTAFCFVILCPL